MVKNIWDAGSMLVNISDFSKPLRVFEHKVPEDWTDFNGHMNEARYLECFSNASDALMQLVGCDEAYIKRGKSFFTVETHIQHLDEVGVDEPVYVTTQILNAEGKKIHLFHMLYKQQGQQSATGEGDLLLATGEQMLLHVDLASRRTSDPESDVAGKMLEFGRLHADLPRPEGMGRAIGQKR